MIGSLAKDGLYFYFLGIRIFSLQIIIIIIIIIIMNLFIVG